MGTKFEASASKTRLSFAFLQARNSPVLPRGRDVAGRLSHGSLTTEVSYQPVGLQQRHSRTLQTSAADQGHASHLINLRQDISC